MAASATAFAASLSVPGGLGWPLTRVSAPLRPASSSPRRVVVVRASSSADQPLREKAAATAAGLAAVAAVAAALAVPEVAEAAPSLSPSLKNFLLSIASGGVVLVAIVGAVVAVSNFDPVKRT